MLKISLENNVQSNKFILITIIGLMDSLEKGLVSIDECERFLFSPYSIEKLRGLLVDKQIINILEKGCELEDIYDLIPDEFINVVKDLKNNAEKVLENLSKISDYKSKK